jgi:hypothetical protein
MPDETQNPGAETAGDVEHIEMPPESAREQAGADAGDDEIEMPPDPLNPAAAAREARSDAWEALAKAGADPTTDPAALADAADAVVLARAATDAARAIDHGVRAAADTAADTAEATDAAYDATLWMEGITEAAARDAAAADAQEPNDAPDPGAAAKPGALRGWAKSSLWARGPRPSRPTKEGASFWAFTRPDP